MLKTNTMNERVSPLTIKIGFGKLFDSYKKQLDSNIPLVAEKAKAVLDLEEKYPELAEGLETQEAIARHKAPIRFILDDLFEHCFDIVCIVCEIAKMCKSAFRVCESSKIKGRHGRA